MPAAVWARFYACPASGQFKGIELYSWHTAEGQWMFSMLPGTNRSKTEAEIKVETKCRLDIGELEREVSRLGEKDDVFWNENKPWGLMLPPSEMIERVTRSARRAGVHLHIIRESAGPPR